MTNIAIALAASFAILGAANAAEQERSVPPFTSISVQGPFNVIVEGGKGQSLTLRGSDKFIKEVVSDVVNGQLVVRTRNKNFPMRGDQHLVVTVPQLRAFSAEGAGEIRLNRMRGERLEVTFRGAGELHVGGEVEAFKLVAEGAGEVDTKDLIASDVDLLMRGVGNVRVTARHRLDAQVQGMGSLTYFGRPKVVNKEVAGLGAVRQGDR